MLEDNELNEIFSSSNQHDFFTDTEDMADLESLNDETQLRLRAVQLYEKGYSINQVVAKTGCSRSSLLSWYKAYRLHGVEGLYDRRQGGNNAKLTDEQIREVVARLRGRTPRDVLGPRAATPEGKKWTVEDLYLVLSQWYGVSYKSRTSYYSLLKKCAEDLARDL